MPPVIDVVSFPVIAAGGIMDGRGIRAARALGARGVQMGTAFLTCSESGAPAVYKAAVRAARDDHTTLTRAFSGRLARGIINAFIQAMQDKEHLVLPYPLEHVATHILRSEAAKKSDPRYLSLWARQAAAMAKDVSAGDLVSSLIGQ